MKWPLDLHSGPGAHTPHHSPHPNSCPFIPKDDRLDDGWVEGYPELSDVSEVVHALNYFDILITFYFSLLPSASPPAAI